MTKGKTDAPNIIIEYTDITCPHCADFHNAAEEGAFDRDYIDSGKSPYGNPHHIAAIERQFSACW